MTDSFEVLLNLLSESEHATSNLSQFAIEFEESTNVLLENIKDLPEGTLTEIYQQVDELLSEACDHLKAAAAIVSPVEGASILEELQKKLSGFTIHLPDGAATDQLVTLEQQILRRSGLMFTSDELDLVIRRMHDSFGKAARFSEEERLEVAREVCAFRDFVCELSTQHGKTIRFLTLEDAKEIALGMKDVCVILLDATSAVTIVDPTVTTYFMAVKSVMTSGMSLWERTKGLYRSFFGREVDTAEASGSVAPGSDVAARRTERLRRFRNYVYKHVLPRNK